MDLGIFLLLAIPLATWSVLSFAALMRTFARRKGWDPVSTYWKSVLAYAFLGYILPFLLLFWGIEIFLYWLSISLATTPVYMILNEKLKRQDRKPASHSSLPAHHEQALPPHPEPARAVPVVTEPKIKPRVEAGTSHIFISYRRSDSADIAGRIYDRLIARFGKGPVFKDVDSIPLGLDFKEYLDQKVGECDVLLAIIGDHWLEAADAAGNRRLDDPSDFVRIEIEAALQRGIPVIPLLVRGASVPREESLPPGLRKLVYRNGIPIRPDPDFHRDMDRLIAALERYVKGGLLVGEPR